MVIDRAGKDGFIWMSDQVTSRMSTRGMRFLKYSPHGMGWMRFKYPLIMKNKETAVRLAPSTTFPTIHQSRGISPHLNTS